MSHANFDGESPSLVCPMVVLVGSLSYMSCTSSGGESLLHVPC